MQLLMEIFSVLLKRNDFSFLINGNCFINNEHQKKEDSQNSYDLNIRKLISTQ